MPVRQRLRKLTHTFALAASLLLVVVASSTVTAATEGWLRWRGPMQSGVSLETSLPESIDAAAASWTFDRSGRGAPVIADGRVFCMAYLGEGPELQESLVCLDEATGRLLWEHRFSDFLSDIIYNRYSITSPSIDPETGRVYIMTTPGLLCCFSPDGEMLWQQPMMEQFGRLTYPNGRTIGPLVDGDLVIFHCMTSSWGPQGPARDRFFGFHKITGDHVWTATPGGPPKDAPYSYPVFETRDGQRLLYAGTAGGNMVCVNARTGESVWRYQMSIGGVCASPLLYRNLLIAVHGKENLDTSVAGRMLALHLGATPGADDPRPLVLDRSKELWRNDELTSFTSSPVLVGNRVYNTIFTGELCCVNANNGHMVWKLKLAPDQIHASPAYANGRLYVPMNNGSFYVLDVTDDAAPKILSETTLDGNCLGAPSIWNGRVYVHTTERLYCFGEGPGEWSGVPGMPMEKPVGEPVALQIIPGDVLLEPGQSVEVRARSIDATGRVVSEDVGTLAWNDSPLDVEWQQGGRTAVAGEPGAATLMATSNGLSGTVRVRIAYPRRVMEDLESIELTMPDKADPSVKFGRPPSHWIGGWPKWDVREKDGSQVIAKTLSNPIFMRSWGFIGAPDSRNYTMQADIMSDGNRRMMSAAGLVNQRYLIVLKGSHRELEIQSNVERVKHVVPFRMTPGVWYRLKTRVDMGADGSATIRAKAWPRDEAEPAEWTAEYTHQHGHTHGAPGIYGFTPQSRFRVYMDNITITPND